MKSDKLNEFLSSCNKLETLNCYYWNDNIIGRQFDINYNLLQKEVLNEITTNLYSLQSNQANLYFDELFQTIEDFILESDLNNTPTFCKYAKKEYERHLLSCWKEEDFILFIEGNFNDVFNEILEERIKSRIDLINTLRSKIKEIKSIYFDGVKNEEHINKDFLSVVKENINLKLNQKLKWKGTPAQFCYIIDLLINKGYIEQPTAKGERSAKILLEHFEFDNYNPTFESLGKNLHKDFDPIKNVEHRKHFQKIPHRNELDK